MALPPCVSWNEADAPSPPSAKAPGTSKSPITIVRKLERVSLLLWADSPAVGDNAEETDDAPLPMAISPRSFGPSRLIPSTIHGRGSLRSGVAPLGFRNPPLRC